MEHLLEATKSKVCKPSVFMSTLLHLYEYFLQCFILLELSAWLTGCTLSFRWPMATTCKQLHYTIFQHGERRDMWYVEISHLGVLWRNPHMLPSMLLLALESLRTQTRQCRWSWLHVVNWKILVQLWWMCQLTADGYISNCRWHANGAVG